MPQQTRHCHRDLLLETLIYLRPGSVGKLINLYPPASDFAEISFLGAPTMILVPSALVAILYPKLSPLLSPRGHHPIAGNDSILRKGHRLQGRY